MDILLDPKTSLCKNFSFIAKFKMAARGQRSKIDQIWPHKSHFGSAFGSRSSILNNIWHRHATWPFKQACARIFHFIAKSKMAEMGTKVQNRPNLSPQITFRLDTWIYFIRFWQNLAWPYYLTLKTSLRKNFLFIAKFKMAPRGQRSKINQIWPHKSHFCSAFGSWSSDLDKFWHGHTT